jgi:hypothetical protein
MKPHSSLHIHNEFLARHIARQTWLRFAPWTKNLTDLNNYRVTSRLNQKSERNVPIFDSSNYFAAGATRFFFFTTSVPGMLVLRASCFTSRLCFATPFEGRFALVLTGLVSNCITPCLVILYFCDWLHIPTRACRLLLWLAGGCAHI